MSSTAFSKASGNGWPCLPARMRRHSRSWWQRSSAISRTWRSSPTTEDSPITPCSWLRSEFLAVERTIRVLLVEDNDVYRASLEFLLARYDGLEVVGSVAMGGAAAGACAELGADVVVIDYRLPDVDGSEVAAELR